MPRAVKPLAKPRHGPLHVQLNEDEVYSKFGKITKPGKRAKAHKGKGSDEEEGGEVRLSSKFSS